jgi:hypothetical protein
MCVYIRYQVPHGSDGRGDAGSGAGESDSARARSEALSNGRGSVPTAADGYIFGGAQGWAWM